MSKPNMEEITTKVMAELADTPYACTELTQLTGGTANFLYKATLTTPLEDGTTHVVVKHAEAFVKNNPQYPLSTDRCRFEEAALEEVHDAMGAVTEGQFTITTPKLLSYNPKTHTQIQEYLPAATNLKHYALEFWPSPTPLTSKPVCHTLGLGLGAWLKRFHEWTDAPWQADSLRAAAKQNGGMQRLKHAINYPNALKQAEKYPGILGQVTETLREIVVMTEKELEDDSKLGVIHGDYWTGNALLPKKAIENDEAVAVNIIDWELVQLGVRPMDLGQMIAELWELKLFKDVDAGEWMIEGFMEGYGPVDEEFAYRVAIHVGCHLINFSGVPGWGTEEQVEGVVERGRDIVKAAWDKERTLFEGTPLTVLL